MARPSNAEEMESCARHRSRVRSCGENSPAETGEEAATGGELCSGGDIGIGGRLRFAAAAAKNESAAAALGDLPVNLGPECGEIIDGGNQRDTDHEPDGGIGDPVHGEDKVAVNRPLFPAMVENDGDHGDDLHHHLELAEFAGFDGKAAGRGDGAQAAHQKLAANDDDGDPRRNQARVELDESNEGGGDEKFCRPWDRAGCPWW